MACCGEIARAVSRVRQRSGGFVVVFAQSGLAALLWLAAIRERRCCVAIA